MPLGRLFCLGTGLLALGCLSPQPMPAQAKPPSLVLTEKNVSLVIAKRATKETGPTGISDRQIFDGKVVAWATFHWDDLDLPAGDQEVEFRWFSGGKAVSSFKKTYSIGRPPYYAWASTTVTNLGLGKARVELYCAGRKVGSRDFELVEARWNQPQPQPMPQLPSKL